MGFIGTGTITEAIVTGILAGGQDGQDIVLSPRSAARAARLADLSPRVRVAGDNQAVADAAGILFLAIRPDVAEAVVRGLRFRPGQLVISLVSTVDHDTLRAWIGGEVDIVRAVPLPFVANRSGVTTVFPPNGMVEALFSQLGTAVPCSTIDEFDLLAAASALMGSFFGIMDHVVGWLKEGGLPQDGARAYLAQHFYSLSLVALRNPSVPLADLRREYSTSGGLNEQMFAVFGRNGGLDALTLALDGVLERLRALRRI
nr:pyrroline-5-carboxylate reductase [Shinella sp. NM-101]